MNIFYTDTSPFQAAKQHCIRHQIKMILEYAQLLSTAHHVLDPDTILVDRIYKPTHQNHPSAIWVRQSADHYRWVHNCALTLCHLFKIRTGNEHKTQAVLDELAILPINISENGFSHPPCCTTNDIEDPVQNYRAFMLEKFAEWQSREKPLEVRFHANNAPWWYECSSKSTPSAK